VAAGGNNRPARVTIVDIAARAGVSRGAVSYALNGRPGLAPSTRQRILDAAAELGWYPNAAARALSGSAVSACGLVLARTPRTLAVEPFFMGLIAGMESKLSAESIALTLQVVESVEAEVVVLRRWWAERRVDGVFVVDLRTDDPRIPLVEDLGFPAVLVGGPEGTEDLPAVWSEDGETMAAVVRYLAKLGHRRLARVAGDPAFRHTVRRTEVFEATVTELGLEGTVVHTDFMAETGAEATRRLLLSSVPPTAVVYDNDILAVAGLGVAHELHVDVPGELSIVAWDDSAYLPVVHPPLTAVSRDIPAFGAMAADVLLTRLRSGTVVRRASPPSVITPRGSTNSPRISR
jgi:DNA-binding LacI/PurR family transcriptional regulator